MKVPFGQYLGLVLAVSFQFWVAAGPLTVKVLCPDGSPFARSRVFYVSGTNDAVLAGSAITAAESLETDSRGRFEFIPSASNVFFLTANDSWFGVAQSRDLTNRPQILLQNWATIIGRRTNLGKPVAAKRVKISFDERCFGLNDVPIILRDEATTDVSGSFVFGKVPAEGLILLEADPGKDLWDLWHVADFIALSSGETRHLELATSARFVSGQLVNKSGVGEASGFAGFVGGVVPASYLTGAIPALPAEYDKPGERTRWWHRWYKSEAGRNIFRPMDQRGALFVVQSNGFFVSDVPIAPGMYRVGGNQKIGGLIVSHWRNCFLLII